ncbi:MAG: four helix bundle protein [Phycisphaerae bacterium]
MTVSRSDRKYDIEDRLLAFTEQLLGVVEALPPTRIGNHIAGQLTRCGTSPLANCAEAQGGESRADFLHKLKVALKELRETRVWLLLIQRKGMVEAEGAVQALVGECNELISILFASVRTAQDQKGGAGSARRS